MKPATATATATALALGKKADTIASIYQDDSNRSNNCDHCDSLTKKLLNSDAERHEMKIERLMMK